MLRDSEDFHRKIFYLVFLLSPVNSLHVSTSPPSGQNVIQTQYNKLFDQDLEIQIGKLNSSYKMKCKITIPGLTFWTVDGHVPDGSKFKISTDSNLIIRNISLEDYDREYLCHALIHGRPVVESMQIYLQPFRDGKSLNIHTHASAFDPPGPSSMDYFQKSTPTPKFGIVGNYTTLTCNVAARPYPTFTWLHANGTIIQNQTDFAITTDHEKESNLTIFVRDTTYYGEKFICEAWNKKGKSEQAFVLQVPEKPKETPFLFPKVIGTRKIELGLILGNPQNYSVIIQWRKVGGNESWNGTSVHGSAENILVETLESNTTYLIRAAFKTEFVLGPESEPILVTTDKEETPLRSEVSSGERVLRQKHGFGRNLQLMRDELDESSNVFTTKVINSKTFSSKWVTKTGNKLIITTNTSTVEEQEVNNVE